MNRTGLRSESGMRESNMSTSMWLPLCSAGANARKNTKTSRKIVMSSTQAIGSSRTKR